VFGLAISHRIDHHCGHSIPNLAAGLHTHLWWREGVYWLCVYLTDCSFPLHIYLSISFSPSPLLVANFRCSLLTFRLSLTLFSPFANQLRSFITKLFEKVKSCIAKMTSAQGTVTSCGPGQAFSLQFTCAGPSCVDLNGFPNTTCTTDNTTLTCTNGVTCPGPTNYTSNFSFSQSNIIVSQTQTITLKDFCEEIDLTSDGTTGGTNATMVNTGPCGPGSSNSSTSITTTTNSSSVGSTGLPSSGILPSTASQNGTYTPPNQPPTTATPPNSTSDKSATILTSPKSSQTVSGSSAAPRTSWSKTGPLLAESSGAWAYWTANGISGSPSVPQESDSTLPTATSGDWSETKVAETAHMSTWPASSSTSDMGFGLSGQAGNRPSEASTGAGSSQATSGVPANTETSQSSYTSHVPLTAPSQGAWSAGSSGAATAGTINPNPTDTPVTSSNGFATTFDTSTGSNSAPPISKFTNNAGSFRHRNAPAVWCVVLLLFSLLVQGTHASTYTFHATPGEFTLVERDVPDNRTLVNYTQHELAKRELTPGWKAFSDAFSEYLAGKLSTPEFADNLVDEVAEAVCDHVAGQVITKALGVDLVEECVAAVYTANTLTAPELEFLSVFGASVLCNLLVSEALPGIEELTNAICNQPKPCSEDLLTDPNNCGSCGNVVSFDIFSPGALAISPSSPWPPFATEPS